MKSELQEKAASGFEEFEMSVSELIIFTGSQISYPV